jgi:hypothetical protein
MAQKTHGMKNLQHIGEYGNKNPEETTVIEGCFFGIATFL